MNDWLCESELLFFSLSPSSYVLLMHRIKEKNENLQLFSFVVFHRSEFWDIPLWCLRNRFWQSILVHGWEDS